jgi:2-haloacid dehalogenase
MSEARFADVQACVFDAYGTLFDFNTPMERRRERIGAEADRLADLWRRKQLEYSWLRSLMGRHADFWKVTGEALDYAMAATGIDNPGLRAELMQLYLELGTYPEAVETVAAVKRSGIKTAVLSNGTPTMLTAVVNASALTTELDAVLSIEACGVYKPHPTVYQLAVDRLEVPAMAVLFLSGNAWDIAGAAAFGFRTVWVNRAGLPRERLPNGPDAEIRSLDALPGLLGR